MAIVKDETIGLIRDELVKRNAKLRDFALLFSNSTWDILRANVRSGLAPELYPIGTELVCKYTLDGVEYDFPWIIVENNRTVTLEGGMEVPGLILQAKSATHVDMPFDASEREIATEEYATDGMYYYGQIVGSGSTASTMLNLQPGDRVPYE